jgi:hypothetical protein
VGNGHGRSVPLPNDPASPLDPAASLVLAGHWSLHAGPAGGAVGETSLGDYAGAALLGGMAMNSAGATPASSGSHLSQGTSVGVGLDARGSAAMAEALAMGHKLG